MRMPKLVIHQEKVEDPQVLVDICPFGAMEEKDGKLSINAACKMCKLCVKKGPAGAVEYVEDEKKEEILLRRDRYTVISAYKQMVSCTVTCRQFPNLTFAPQKTRHSQAATSCFIAIMSQQVLVYTKPLQNARAFFVFF